MSPSISSTSLASPSSTMSPSGQSATPTAFALYLTASNFLIDSRARDYLSSSASGSASPSRGSVMAGG
jgi:hypothetical protein